eukprot:CAMPEP_0206183968 /NCGR_PEP_ID=MMETSP0166-20121206/947_1 /ASSEMBLY_ACC=CAM_ASM_000260 /TAXON_ID=95228 /ORGANISM="Vannella robusta, Strain DIVA3 518/3/11/1/6" /LENGTH=70 /DNA_ID=CAMNT_0053598911 /DNA_START=552 /DNA_END=764 /DNA_ORIENTATION=+
MNKIHSIATQVVETITHKDIDGDGKVGGSEASAVVNVIEGQTGMDLDGDGKVAGKAAAPGGAQQAAAAKE